MVLLVFNIIGSDISWGIIDRRGNVSGGKGGGAVIIGTDTSLHYGWRHRQEENAGLVDVGGEAR